MHSEILSEEQKDLLPFVSSFKAKFYLIGGTAIALQIGHRKSIYFDLFCRFKFQVSTIHKKWWKVFQIVERFIVQQIRFIT